MKRKLLLLAVLLAIAAAGLTLALSEEIGAADSLGSSGNGGGGLIAYVATGGDAPGLYVVKPDGTEDHLLIAGNDLGDPRWSPDGTKITFLQLPGESGPAALKLLRLSDLSVSTVLPCVGYAGNSVFGYHFSWPVEWSPDSSKIATSSCTASVVVVDVATGASTIISGDPRDGFPSWHPSGASLIFRCYVHVCIVDADGTNLRTLPPYGPIAGPPKWSPDASSFLVPYVGGAGSAVVVYDADGENGRTVWGGDPFDNLYSFPAWSPDGRFIALAGGGDLCVPTKIVDVAGASVFSYPIGRPLHQPWSPDGTTLVAEWPDAQTGCEPGNGGLYVQNADGSGLQRIVDTPADEWGAAWGPAVLPETPTPTPTPTCGPRLAVFIGGIAFTFSSDANLTKPAKQWDDPFADIAQSLKSDYKSDYPDGDADFRWFNYSPNWDESQYNSATQDNGQYNGADTRQKLEFSALALNKQISLWSSKCPDSRIDIIAHSLGGAVAAYWAGHGFDAINKVHTILTIESPLGGVPAANCWINAFVKQFYNVAGPVSLDLCDSSANGVKDTMKKGLEKVPFLAVNNRADPVVDSYVAQGVTRADGLINGTLNGRVWDSRDFGTPPRLRGVTDLINVLQSAASEHMLPLHPSCPCWPHLIPKLVGATMYDDRPSSSVTYSPTGWTHETNSARVMGTDSVSSKPGSTVTLNVPDPVSKVVWIAMKGPRAGHAKVSVCGGPEQDIFLWSPLFDARQEYEFNIPASCSGPELTIRVPSWIGRLGRDVNVDAFEAWK